jgi:TnpA family transposase
LPPSPLSARIYPCGILELRREINEGLNVVENWNSANNFILYGKGGEFATNRREDQEITMLSLHLLQLEEVEDQKLSSAK